MSTTIDLDLAFKALGDRTRREVLRMLARGEKGVLELASNFELTQPAVTKHLNVLEKAGLISRERQGRYRICRMEPEAVEQTAGWLEDLGDYWRRSFDAIDRILEEEKKETR